MKTILQYKLILNAAIFALLLAVTGCESFVDIPPSKTDVVTETVYADDASALAAVRGIYHELNKAGFASGQATSLTFCAGLSADEFKSLGSSYDEFYNNMINPTSGTNNTSLWSSMYKTIYYANSAIEGLTKSTTISVESKKQLLGEAKFLRAFSYFHLINLYGNVPLILSSDYRANSVASRMDANLIYQQITSDLVDAQSLLSKDYSFAAGERVRVNSFAAAAFLARVYLFTGNWAKAEELSSAVIANSSLYKIVTDFNSVFLKNSTEAIWQIMPTVAGINTYEAQNFIPASPTTVLTTVSLNDKLIAAFEINDKRKTNWTGTQVISGTTYVYPFKYKVRASGQPLTEYSMVLRLAEQYLIRAEAYTMQGKFTEAIADINVLRIRASLGSVTSKLPSISADNLNSAILQERRIELFSEWGHRWFDLKRTGQVNAVMSAAKPTWTSAAALYPLPQTELINDPNLGPQNPGY